MRLLVLCGSLRRASLNLRLARAAASMLEDMGHEARVITLHDVPLPLYDGDLDQEGERPESLSVFQEMLLAHDGLLIASPEYNHSVAGPLKNAVDWVSRIRPNPLAGLPTFLMAASPGAVGGHRGMKALRPSIELLGAPVLPSMYALSGASEAFDDAGSLQHPQQARRLRDDLDAFTAFATALLPLRKREPRTL